MAAFKGSIVIVSLLIASLFQSTSGATHLVGDTAGWSIPQVATFYDEWAGKQNFVVGDKLAFISTAIHNVYEVSATDAGDCDASNPLDIFLSASPTVTLSSAGTHAFMCGVAGHCIKGMKMIVDVATVPRFTNSTPPTLDKSTGMGPAVAPTLSPPAPPPSSALSLRFSPALAIGAALAVTAFWVM